MMLNHSAFTEKMQIHYPKNTEKFERIFSPGVYDRYGVTARPTTESEEIFISGVDPLNFKPYVIESNNLVDSEGVVIMSEKIAWKQIDLWILSHSAGITPWGTTEFPIWTKGIQPESNEWYLS